MTAADEPPKSLADQLYAQDEGKAQTAREAEQEKYLHDLEHSPWNGVDIEPALQGMRPPPPSVWERTDGRHALYRGKIHWFQGEPESLKSLAAQSVAKEVIARGGDVAYVDYEGAMLDVVNRLIDLGAPKADLREHLTYCPIDISTHASPGHTTAYEHLLASRPWQLIVLDGTTDSIALQGLEANSGADIALWLSALPKKMSATGATVIVIDHVTKSTEGRGRWAIGSGHKLAGLDGASFTFDIITPLSAAVDGEMTEGSARVTVNKDRNGAVRAICDKSDRKTLGTFRVKAYPDQTLDAGLTPEADLKSEPRQELYVKVAHVLQAYPGSTTKAVSDRLPDMSESEVAVVLMAMVDAGWARAEAIGQSHKHTLTMDGVRSCV